MSDLISEEELPTFMKKVPEWELNADSTAVLRELEFEDFMEAIDFVNDVAEIAEEAQHHPDIEVRYNRITLSLTTHDVGGITEPDFQMAQRIDTLRD